VAYPIRRPKSRADRRQSDYDTPQWNERRNLEVPPVKVQWKNEPDGLVIALTNPLVVSNCFAARDRLVSCCDRSSASCLTVDLSGVPYADTAGVGMLSEIYVHCLRDRKQLVLRNPTPRVLELLELLQLDRRLRIEEQ